MKIGAGAFLWLGIGFLVHLIFLGAAVASETIVLSLFIIVLWPVYLVWKFFVLAWWLCLFAAVCFFIYFLYCKITGRPFNI